MQPSANSDTHFESHLPVVINGSVVVCVVDAVDVGGSDVVVVAVVVVAVVVVTVVDDVVTGNDNNRNQTNTLYRYYLFDVITSY